MLCRALLAIIAISYLICVLILSGLQKDDLDGNMAKKLERHGLDIEDMNNESLREDCFKGVKTTDKNEVIYTENPTTISTTAKFIETNQQQDTPNEKDTNKSEFKGIIKYFKDLRNSGDKSNTKNVYKTNTENKMFVNYPIPQSSNLKYIFSNMIRYNSPQVNNIQTSTTEGTFPLFSENILKIWNTYSKQDLRDFTTSEPTTLNTSSLNSIGIKYKDTEIDIVNKMFADYISKNLILSATTQLPTNSEIDIARLADEVRRFIASTQNASKRKLRNSDNDTDEITTIRQNNVYTSVSKETENLSNRRPIAEDKNDVTIFLKHKSEGPVTDKMRLDKQTKINGRFAEQNIMENSTENSSKNNNNIYLENYKSPQDDSMFNSVNNLYAIMEKRNHPKVKEITLPNDIIKEIAEKVKEIVLRDLKKEILTITTTSTTRTTETIRAITSKHGVETEATYMMEKFMELFQQFQTTKEKTIIAGHSQMRVTEKKNVKHEYTGPVKIVYSSNKPAISAYGVRSPTEQFAPIFDKRYNNEPSMTAPKNIVLPNVQNPVFQVQQIDNYKVKAGLRLAPITIQTNAFEVPPLGIPITKPLRMVNQNIIVTTKSPHLRPRLDTQHTNYVHYIDRYNIEDDFRSINDWKPQYNLRRDFKPRVRDDAYKLEKHDNVKIKISDRSSSDNHNNRDYKPHFTKSDYDRMKLRNQELKRFHERLENTDELMNSDDKQDRCDMRVASRQQLPLTNAKTGSKFDDVHFRNFLKTQQKVNAMLEKILSTRTKSDGPHSVETT